LVKWPLEKAIDAINNLQIVDYFNGDHSEMIRRRKDIIKQLVENGEKVVNVIFHPKKKKILKKVVKFVDID
jgi:precorrin-2 methylase